MRATGAILLWIKVRQPDGDFIGDVTIKVDWLIKSLLFGRSNSKRT
jgi:hypothetical protein